MCGTFWCEFVEVSVCCVWDSLVWVCGSECVLCVDSLVWVWGKECVLCVGHFGMGL